MKYIGSGPTGHWELKENEGVSFSMFNADNVSDGVKILTEEETRKILLSRALEEANERKLHDGWERQDNYNQTGKL